MKFLKYCAIALIMLMLLLFSGYTVIWYYVVNKITTDINTKYANQKHHIYGGQGGKYYIKFHKASASGYPFAVSLKIEGIEEEGVDRQILYYAPLMIGYNFLTGNFGVNYDGDAKALFKPASLGFGSKYKINNYSFTAKIPISFKLLSSIKNMKDNFELINYVNNFTLGTGRVMIYDLVDDSKLYDKEYERINFSFKPRKYYKSQKDFLSNIPREYNFAYQVKTSDNNNHEFRKIPQSLLYIFIPLPSSFIAQGNGQITTKASTIKEFRKDVNVNANFETISPSWELQSLKFRYQGNANQNVPNFVSQIDTVLFVKQGFFDKLFDYYDKFKYLLEKNDSGKILAAEVEYIRNNRQLFKLHELENVKYNFNTDLLLKHVGNNTTLKFNNLSLLTEDAGFKVTSDYEIKKRKQDSIWHLKGNLYLKNYAEMIEFTSPYVYRFGKFRDISDIARDLYIDLNKQFLSRISDYPNSKSKDLSFTYDIHSQYLDKAKIGKMNIKSIKELYLTMLYQKVLGVVGIKGNVLDKMKDFVPDIDKDQVFIKNILPQLDRMKEKSETKLDQGKIIQKIVPKKHKQKLEKDLKKHILKNLVK